MSKDPMHERRLAVRRFLNGEKPLSICTSLGKSQSWLYKWVNRFDPNDLYWCESRSTRPFGHPHRTPTEIEKIVKITRLNLYNSKDCPFFGAQAILWEMEDLGVTPLPSERTINRILVRNSLTHKRTGSYEPKGTLYPELPADRPNQTHQADLRWTALSEGADPLLQQTRCRYCHGQVWHRTSPGERFTEYYQWVMGYLEPHGHP